MSIKAGLVGLPNVGKSTLFNALTKSQVPAANYPFCTIDPHLAITHVPDERSERLKKIYNSQEIIPASISFVDIAGLVKGAASGEGLGNQFLSHIREVDLIIHVLRCFIDSDIIHTSADVDPLTDYQIIVAELMLKDLESIEKRLVKIESLAKAHKSTPAEKKTLEQEKQLLTHIITAIDQEDAKKIRQLVLDSPVPTIPLLAAKDFLIIANISESELENNQYEQNKNYQNLVSEFGTNKVIPLSAKIEQELTNLNEEDSHEIMNMMGIKERGLNKVIEKTYTALGLITFFTCGPKEIHAWPIKKGMTIRQAAGEIHSDLQRGFICAEVFNYADLIQYGSTAKLKDVGKIKTEGQDYLVQDGDIVLIRFNV